MAGDKSPKRKPGQCQRPLGCQLGDDLLHVNGFATAFVVSALALAHAPEIETHGSPATLHKSTRQSLYNFILHGATKQGVGMGNHGRTLMRAIGRLIQ